MKTRETMKGDLLGIRDRGNEQPLAERAER